MSDRETIQFIFVVETSKEAWTDCFYIDEILRRFYFLGENKRTYSYMNGKHNYKRESVKKDIFKKIKDYGINPDTTSYVIYVFDKDKNTSSSQDANFVKKVKEYCRDNNYLLVWFVRDIEEVMWGERVESNKKREAAKRFIGRGKHMNNVAEKNLLAGNNVNQKGKSNILTILNKFPEIKKK